MFTESRLKSFVLRKGRITLNQKHAIETFWDQYVLNEKDDIDEFLENKHSILDIGFGAVLEPRNSLVTILGGVFRFKIDSE